MVEGGNGNWCWCPDVCWRLLWRNITNRIRCRNPLQLRNGKMKTQCYIMSYLANNHFCQSWLRGKWKTTLSSPCVISYWRYWIHIPPLSTRTLVKTPRKAVFCKQFRLVSTTTLVSRKAFWIRFFFNVDEIPVNPIPISWNLWRSSLVNSSGSQFWPFLTILTICHSWNILHHFLLACFTLSLIDRFLWSTWSRKLRHFTKLGSFSKENVTSLKFNHLCMMPLQERWFYL